MMKLFSTFKSTTIIAILQRKVLSFLLITISTCCYAQNDNNPFFHFKQIDGIWKAGYLNQNGKVIIPYHYESGSSFSEGIAAVQKDGKWGYINKKGETTIDFIYENAQPFKDGLGAVSKNGKYGYINSKGNVIIQFQYDTAAAFINGLASVQKGNHHFLMNKKEEVVIPSVFDKINPFSENLAAVQRGNSYGFINKKGNIVIPLKFNKSVGSFHEGRARFGEGWKCGFIDKKGNKVIPAQYYNASDFKNGMSIVENKDDYIGVINQNGEIIIPCIYDYIDEYTIENEAFVVWKDGLCGLVNTKGKIILPIEYDAIIYWEAQKLLTISKDEKFGAMSKSGKLLIPFKYERLRPTKNKRFIAEINKRSAVITIDEEQIIPFEYDYIDECLSGYIIQKGKHFGLLDFNGKEILPTNYSDVPLVHKNLIVLGTSKGDYEVVDLNNKKVIGRYDYVLPFSGGMAIVNKNGLEGYINETGTLVIPIIYTNAVPFSEGIAFAQKEQTSVMLDLKGTPTTMEHFGFYIWKKGVGISAINKMQFLINKKGQPIK